MAKLSDKLHDVLEEGLILITATEVVLGFQYRSVFESGFERLPAHSQALKVVGLALMLAALGLLLAPAAYHKIVRQGENHEQMHRFTTVMLGAALVPFALGVAGDLYVVIDKVLRAPALALGGALLALAGFYGLWFGYSYSQRRTRASDVRSTGAIAAHKRSSAK